MAGWGLCLWNLAHTNMNSSDPILFIFILYIFLKIEIMMSLYGCGSSNITYNLRFFFFYLLKNCYIFSEWKQNMKQTILDATGSSDAEHQNLLKKTLHE